jgi:hypothetical protein
MRRELGQLSLADGLVEGGAGRNRQLEKIAALVEEAILEAVPPELPGWMGAGPSPPPRYYCQVIRSGPRADRGRPVDLRDEAELPRDLDQRRLLSDFPHGLFERAGIAPTQVRLLARERLGDREDLDLRELPILGRIEAGRLARAHRHAIPKLSDGVR